LKFPAREDPQAKEMAETKGHKEDMLNLIMEKNAHIKEMEAVLENLVKEKEQSVPMEFIPLNVVPLTEVSTTTTTSVTTTEDSKKLSNSMEDMSL
jgi:predicted YcjX-like family ATPase